MRDHPHVVVVLGGDDGPDQRLVPLRTPDLVVVADSGLHRADALGLGVDHVVGDLDSVAPGRLAMAVKAGAEIHAHSADKDATDAELALRFAHDRFAVGSADPPGERRRLVVIGGSTGRVDLLLADLLLLGGPFTEPFDTVAHIGPSTISVVRPGRPVAVRGGIGEQVSLLPVHGPAAGVATEGLRWPLVDAVLSAATTRGVSNELVREDATVQIDDGVLLVVQQGIVAPVNDRREGLYDPSPRG